MHADCCLCRVRPGCARAICGPEGQWPADVSRICDTCAMGLRRQNYAVSESPTEAARARACVTCYRTGATAYSVEGERLDLCPTCAAMARDMRYQVAPVVDVDEVLRGYAVERMAEVQP